MAVGSVFDVGAFIDRQRLGRLQIQVMVLCTIVMLVDGYDVFVLGYVVPSLSAALQIRPADLAPVFAMQAVGLAIGNYLVSPIADRIGRKPTLLLSLLTFGIATLLTTRCTTIPELIAARLIGGIFMASMVPNAIALTTEIAPRHYRGTLVSWMFAGYMAGAALGGGVAAFAIAHFGWQSAFLVGGCAPFLLAPILFVFLPESLRFEAKKRPDSPMISAMLRRMDPTLGLTGDERFVLREPDGVSLSVPALFRDGRALMTSMLWVAFFMNLMVINLLGAYLPTFLKEYGGLTPSSAAGVSSFSSIAGIIAAILISRFLDRFGAARVLAISYGVAVLSLLWLGVLDMSTAMLYVAIFFLGATAKGGQGGLNALSAVIYPTAMRATGVSWAFGAGRVGSIVAPLVGGWILQNHLSAFAAFAITAIPMLLAGISMLFVTFVPSTPESAAVAAAE